MRRHPLPIHLIPLRSVSTLVKQPLAALILVALLALATSHAAAAQFGLAFTAAGDTGIGGQLSWMRSVALFDLVDGAKAGGEFTVYRPEDLEGTDVTRIDFEGASVLKVPVLALGQGQVYGVGGVNYAYTYFGNDDVALFNSVGNVGLILGGGASFQLGILNAFGEARINLGGLEQVGVVLGLRFGR